jgi:hypothetical protein
MEVPVYYNGTNHYNEVELQDGNWFFRSLFEKLMAKNKVYEEKLLEFFEDNFESAIAEEEHKKLVKMIEGDIVDFRHIIKNEISRQIKDVNSIGESEKRLEIYRIVEKWINYDITNFDSDGIKLYLEAILEPTFYADKVMIQATANVLYLNIADIFKVGYRKYEAYFKCIIYFFAIGRKTFYGCQLILRRQQLGIESSI